MIEQWRRHPTHSDYEISDWGRVKRVTPNKGARVGRILKQSSSPSGYLGVNVGGTRRNVHTLVLETFVGLKPSRMESRHRNDVKTDNKLSNLAWGTHSENYRDRVINGGGQHGSRHGLAKLTESDVIEMRRAFSCREATQPELAARFDVTDSLVSMMINRRRWKHI